MPLNPLLESIRQDRVGAEPGSVGPVRPPTEVQGSAAPLHPLLASIAADRDTPTGDNSKLAQIGEGLAYGVKSALDPWQVTKEEATKHRTGLGTVSSLVGNFGAGLGAATGTGALIGTAVLPGVGTVAGGTLGAILYGIYAGVGNEKIHSTATGEAFNPARAAAGAVLEVNPLIKSASLANRVLRTAAGMAGAAGVEYWRSEDGLAAGIAGAASILGYIGMRPEHAPTPGTANAVADLLASDAGHDLLVKSSQRMEQLAPSELQWHNGLAEDPAFQRWMVGSTEDLAVGKAKELLSKMSLEHRNDTAQLFKQHEILVDEARKVADTLSKSLDPSAAEPFHATVGYLKDAKFAARDIDRTTGLNVEGVFDGFSRAKERHDIMAAAWMAKAQQAKDLQRAAGISETNMGKALAGELEPKSEAGKQAVAAWRGVFDGVRGQVRKAGYDVGDLTNYFPMENLRGADLRWAVQSKITDLTERAAKAGKSSILELGKDPDLQDLLTVARRITGKSEIDQKDLLTLANQAGAVAKTSTGFEPSAVFQRSGGDMPGFVRDYNVGKVFMSYVNRNLKAANLGPEFRALQRSQAALTELGLERAAAYLGRYGEQISGGGRDSKVMQLVDATIDSLKTAGYKLEASGHEQVGRAVKAIPDMAAWMSSQVYPAWLGLNVRATLRNLTQTYMTTAPELGGAFGYNTVSRAVLDTVQDARKLGGFKGMEAYLRSKGQAGQFMRNETIVDAASLPSDMKHMVGKINDIAMGLYSRTDVINRYIALKAGERWAQSVTDGNPAALKALTKLGTGGKSKIRAEGLLKDPAALGDFLGDQLIGKTQFRYGREQMSAFGRDFGPMFSAFTKWPTMVASDVVEMAKRKDYHGMASKILPYLALSGAGAMLAGNEPNLPDFPAQQYGPGHAWHYLVGDDLTDLSPMKAGLGLAFGGGPAIKAVAGIASGIGAVSRGKSAPKEAAGRLAAGALTTYVPLVAPVLNELDRWRKAGGRQGYADELKDTISGSGPDQPGE